MVNNKTVLTLNDAIAYMESEGNAFAQKMIWNLAARSDFMPRLAGEVTEHRRDCHGLGKAWKNIEANFYRLLKVGVPDDVRDALLRDATTGLKRLDPRFADVTPEILAIQPELVYIGLVNKHVEHAAKTFVTDSHRMYLVVRQTQIAQAA